MPPSDRQLIRANVGAASLHCFLLVLLLVNFHVSEPANTSVNLFEEAPVYVGDRCQCIPRSGLKTIESQVDLFWMTVSFTVITLGAHLFYASNVKNLYISTLELGKNPFRWIEYGISASIMLSILSVQAGNKDKNLFILMFVATFSQMLQGYCIESAVANDGSVVDKLVPLVAGWALLVGTWYIIYEKWYKGLSYAFENADLCRADSPTDFHKPPTSYLYSLVVLAL